MNKQFASIVLLATTAQAWWDKGHIITARVAYDILEAEAPAALESANTLLEVLANDSDIKALHDENKYPFVECAPFADAIKGQGLAFQANWHFVDTPYLDEDQDISHYNVKEDGYMNVTNVIKEIDMWLSGASGYEKTQTHELVMQHVKSEDDGKSFVLRLLIHLVGDAHQPCHSMTRVDSKFPKGDRGCNFDRLPNKEGASNLHAVWDSVVYEEGGRQKLPLTEDDWSNYGSISKEFSSKHPVSESDYKTADPQAWADENIAIAADIYDFTLNEPLTDEYIQKNREHAEKRISFAGRRLAEMIKTYFNSSNAETLFFQ